MHDGTQDMRQQHGPATSPAPSVPGDNGGEPSGPADWLERLLALATLHLYITAHLLLIAGPTSAVVYAIAPPLAACAAVLVLLGHPGFALCTLGMSTGMLVLAARWLRADLASRSPTTRYAIWIALLLWVPVMSGEVVREVVMRSQIAAARPDCYEMQAMIVSLHEALSVESSRSSHAWMSKNGIHWHWSYASMSFQRESTRRPVAGRECPAKSRPETSDSL